MSKTVMRWRATLRALLMVTILSSGGSCGGVSRETESDSTIQGIAGTYTAIFGTDISTLRIESSGRFELDNAWWVKGGCSCISSVENPRHDIHRHRSTEDRLVQEKLASLPCLRGESVAEWMRKRGFGAAPVKGCRQFTGLTEFKNDLLTLRSVPECKELGSLLFVRWGSRRYLIPEWYMAEFCNDVNLGYDPRPSESRCVFLHHDDRSHEITGLPKLGKPWDRYLMKEPLRGQVIEILSNERSKVDLGARDGVFPGMILLILGKLDSLDDLEALVIAVEDKCSTVEHGIPYRGFLERGPRVVSSYKGIYSRNGPRYR